MDDIIKKDILSVLGKAIGLIEKGDFTGLKELSNHINHNASIYQDENSVQAAVVIYALSKILERARQEGRKITFDVAKQLKDAENFLKNEKEHEYSYVMKKLLKEISQSDEKILLFVQNVIEKANIVKGSNIYGHGISIGRTAELLGINQWDLMSFIGKTRIADKEEFKEDITKRLAFARALFK